MNKLPILLIWSRVLIGVAILVLSLAGIANFPFWGIPLMVVGLLTDVFDGILARKLKISTEKLRRLDSSVDQVFWVLVALATLVQAPDFFKENALPLSILLVFEAGTYLISYLKFRKEVATHAIASKLWTLTMLATILQLMATGESGWLFTICLYGGLITRLEIIVILLVLKEWTNDVPSFYHAIRLRQGKNISRHPLFNG